MHSCKPLARSLHGPVLLMSLEDAQHASMDANSAAQGAAFLPTLGLTFNFVTFMTMSDCRNGEKNSPTPEMDPGAYGSRKLTQICSRVRGLSAENFHTRTRAKLRWKRNTIPHPARQAWGNTSSHHRSHSFTFFIYSSSLASIISRSYQHRSSHIMVRILNQGRRPVTRTPC